MELSWKFLLVSFSLIPFLRMNKWVTLSLLYPRLKFLVQFNLTSVWGHAQFFNIYLFHPLFTKAAQSALILGDKAGLAIRFISWDWTRHNTTLKASMDAEKKRWRKLSAVQIWTEILLPISILNPSKIWGITNIFEFILAFCHCHFSCFNISSINTRGFLSPFPCFVKPKKFSYLNEMF